METMPRPASQWVHGHLELSEAASQISMHSLRWLSFAIVLGVMAGNTAAWACGGGGSGAYRKPPRPGHSHTKAVSQAAPSLAQPSTQPATEATKSR